MRPVGSLLLKLSREQLSSNGDEKQPLVVIALKAISSYIPVEWACINEPQRKFAAKYWAAVKSTPFPTAYDQSADAFSLCSKATQTFVQETNILDDNCSDSQFSPHDRIRTFLLPEVDELTIIRVPIQDGEQDKHDRLNIEFGACIVAATDAATASKKEYIQLMNLLLQQKTSLGKSSARLLSALEIDQGQALMRILGATAMDDASNPDSSVSPLIVNVDTVLPIGTDCASAQASRFADLRRCGYPLDWVRTHPKGILQMLRDCLEGTSKCGAEQVKSRLVPAKHALDTGAYWIHPPLALLSTELNPSATLLCDPGYLFVGPAQQMQLYAQRMHRLPEAVLGTLQPSVDDESVMASSNSLGNETAKVEGRRLMLLHIGHVEHSADELRIGCHRQSTTASPDKEHDDPEPCDTEPLLHLLHLRQFLVEQYKTEFDLVHIVAFNVASCPDFDWPGITHRQLEFQGYSTGGGGSSGGAGGQWENTARRVAQILTAMVSLR